MLIGTDLKLPACQGIYTSGTLTASQRDKGSTVTPPLSKTAEWSGFCLRKARVCRLAAYHGRLQKSRLSALSRIWLENKTDGGIKWLRCFLRDNCPKWNLKQITPDRTGSIVEDKADAQRVQFGKRAIQGK